MNLLVLDCSCYPVIDNKLDYHCLKKGWFATMDEDVAPFVTVSIPGMNRNENQPESCCHKLLRGS